VERSRRERLIRGAQAQTASHVVRVIVQVGGVAVLASTWGLNLYGEWLILSAVPNYLTFSDVGLFSAASTDMVLRHARDDREGALRVFQAVSTGVTILFAGLAVVLIAVAAGAPLTSWLNLSTISELEASWVLVALGLGILVTSYAGVLWGGFACEGRYGAGGAAIAGILLADFLSLATVVLLGGGPALGATAMLVSRLVTTGAMYAGMRHYAPWLHLGRAPGTRKILRELLSPALATGAFSAGFSLNVQGMVILVGVVLTPAAAAIFSTLRTMSRVVIQLLASVFTVIAPELSKAHAANDPELLRRLHRRGCQAAVWLAAPILLVLALFGDSIIDVWTGGTVQTQGALLYLFLAVAGIDALWYTSLAVVYAQNRHQRLAVYYIVASVVSLAVGYVLLEAWGLDGAAAALVMLEVFMLCAVLREALPAAHDTLKGWLLSIARPPRLASLPALLRVRGERVGGDAG
jgi:O-antigen/teichoic acid export membrane protein